jgi:O-antigen/teichoic acid export membrane protein
MIKRTIAYSDFSKSVLTLISGTTVAQAISIGISPLLSRIYSPAEFGVFGTFSAVIALIALIIGGRYEGAILLPKSDEEAANLFALSFIINIILSLLSFFAVFLLSFLVPTSVKESELFNWFYLIPLFTFFIGLWQTVNCWYNRKKMYRGIVMYRITNSAINNTSSLSLGYMKLPVNGLVVSYMAANLLSVAVFWSQIKKDYNQYKGVISKKEMLCLAKRYKRFPLTNSLQSISDAFQVNGIIYFVNFFFDLVFVGIFSFAMRILLVPMNFAGSAMAQVFYQHASETHNSKGDLTALVKSTILKSLIIAVPILIILLLFGPQLFSFVFGEKWVEAGVYARILAPWLLLDFIRAPLSQVPIIVGKHNRLLYISLFSNIIVFISMLFSGIVLHDLKTGLCILSVFESLYIIGIIIWIYKIASIKLN